MFPTQARFVGIAQCFPSFSSIPLAPVDRRFLSGLRTKADGLVIPVNLLAYVQLVA